MLKFQKSIYTVFLILVVASLFLSHIHEVMREVLFSDFTDFRDYYFFSKALRLNYDIYKLDQATAEQLNKELGTSIFSCGPGGQSPMFYFLMRGITFFKYYWASIIWLLLNNIFLLGSILTILKLTYEKIPDIDRNFIGLSSIFFVFFFQPLIENMYFGQLNLLILFLYVLCLYFLDKKKYILSGCLLSLCIFIKPQYGILLPFFLWKRCYRVFFTGLVSFIILEISSVLLNGINIEFEYWTIATKGNFIYNLTGMMSLVNLSLFGLIARIINLSVLPGYINIVIGLVSIFSFALLIYTLRVTGGRFRGLDQKFILEFSLVIIFLLIVFPVVHEHYYVLLYLPIIFLWAKLSRSLKLFPLSLFILSFWLVGLKYSLMSFPIFNAGILAIFSGFKLYGVIILFFLTAYVVKKEF